MSICFVQPSPRAVRGLSWFDGSRNLNVANPYIARSGSGDRTLSLRLVRRAA